MLAVWLLVLFFGIVLLAHLRLSATISLILVAVYLVAMTLVEVAPGLLMLILALLWVVVALPLFMPDLRRQRITAPALKWFRGVLPPMSETERDAIEAGTVWWDGELFSGRPDWNHLLSVPAPRLTAEEQAFVDGPTEELCAMVSDWEIGQRLDLPPEAWAFIKEQGFFGLIIPREYGGKGFSALAHSQIVMKLSTRSADLASTVMVPNSLGPAELLLHYGTDEQRQRYLPRLARGEEIPCFALTGPLAGSDAGAMPDTGVICRGQWEGEEVLGLRLNWEKRYITLGPVATLLGLAFKAYDPDHLLGDKEELGITLALIPTHLPGIDIGKRHLPLGAAFMNGPNAGKDVFVPLDAIIGGPAMLGKGWMMLMNCLSVGRSISLPAVGTSAAKTCAYASGRYARIREQFNVPLSAFEGIQAPLARLAGNAWLMDAARVLTARAVDLGEKPSVLSAVLKYHLTERGRECIAHAMDIHGGKGIIMGPNNYLARAWQGAPIFITVEGANILSRNLMIFGQGAIRSHPYVLKEMELAAAEDSEANLERFDRLLLEHVGFAVSNAASSLLLGITGGFFSAAPGHGVSQRYFRRLNRLAAAFALLADTAMLLLGGSLKRRERLSARLGDALSYLYLGSAALKRFHDLGHPQEQEPLLRWALEESLQKAETALAELLDNFPSRPLAMLLHVLVFPMGRLHKGPSDALEAQLAEMLDAPLADPVLSRLLDGVYLPEQGSDGLGALEHAWRHLHSNEAIRKLLQRAVKEGQLRPQPGDDLIDAALAAGVLNEPQAAALREEETARRRVIDVDAFDPQLLEPSPGKVR